MKSALIAPAVLITMLAACGGPRAPSVSAAIDPVQQQMDEIAAQFDAGMDKCAADYPGGNHDSQLGYMQCTETIRYSFDQEMDAEPGAPPDADITSAWHQDAMALINRFASREISFDELVNEQKRIDDHYQTLRNNRVTSEINRLAAEGASLPPPVIIVPQGPSFSDLQQQNIDAAQRATESANMQQQLDQLQWNQQRMLNQQLMQQTMPR